MSDKLIRIGVAVNDPDNGTFTGRCEVLEFECDLLYIADFNVAFRVDGNRVKLCRRWFPILYYGTWVGNWCWDAFSVTCETAADIANYLRTFGGSPEQGCEELWDLWESGDPFVAKDFEVLA